MNRIGHESYLPNSKRRRMDTASTKRLLHGVLRLWSGTSFRLQNSQTQVSTEGLPRQSGHRANTEAPLPARTGYGEETQVANPGIELDPAHSGTTRKSKYMTRRALRGSHPGTFRHKGLGPAGCPGVSGARRRARSRPVPAYDCYVCKIYIAQCNTHLALCKSVSA